jgi:hypothetical protein
VPGQAPLAVVAQCGQGATRFSVRGREPSFRQGLAVPWLRSVLRRGIAHLWGVQRHAPGPIRIRMLTFEPLSRLRRGTTGVGQPGTAAFA